MKKATKKFSWCAAVLGLALGSVFLCTGALAQDADDPPGRVARLGYLQGSVSFQPAGETDWVGAVPNRPMTTGDQLWTDENSRAEVQLGSAVVRLGPNTGFSFLNLDDDTVQIQLTSGSINVTVRRLDDNDDFEIDTPNQAFTAFQPGHYRVDASADGNATVISVRQGDGQATGGGQSYEMKTGQVGTFSGSDSLYADVEPIGGMDDFDNWAYQRDRRYDSSRSAQYLSRDVVGIDDLDDYGDWRDDPNYGHVWYPNQVQAGWAPYREGHWDWIAPWGWTWVDDSSWGYAPFHYGRWVTVGGRWGWVAGPVAVRAVYAPALVVFIGGGGGGFSGNVGWFPLGPREVYVPSYHVSPAYVNRVNISNTTVNVTQVTNVYNTTIINKTVNITNVTYVNRTVVGAVTAVPQRTFVSAQPVARAVVAVNARDVAAAPMTARVAVAPTEASVLGARAATANHVAAPPAMIANRQVVAKKTPPPPPVPFAKQQQALAAHPGQPLARSEVQNLRPAVNTAAARPMVKQAPPAKPATPAMGHPAQPMNRPGSPAPAAQPNRPAVPQQENRTVPQPPVNRAQPTPVAPQPNRPEVPQQQNRSVPQPPVNRAQPTPVAPQPNRPEVPQQQNRPVPQPPANRAQPTPVAPQPNRPEVPQQQNRAVPQPPVNRAQPTPVAPQPNRPEVPQQQNRAVPQPPVNRAQPTPVAPQPSRPEVPQQQNRAVPKPPQPPPPAAKPAPPPKDDRSRAMTPDQKKQEEQRRKQEEKEKPNN